MRAVIMSGGKGTRLAPYTTILPKPLMPIGTMPILELVIRRLKLAGIDHVTLAVGHLASLIMAYFGTGERFGVPIDYSLEETPLGTAGPLRLIANLDETFLVLNGDLMTDLNFDNLIETHRRNAAVATVGVYTRKVPIDLGVITTDQCDNVAEYIEKPTYTFLVSMGVYAFEPVVLSVVNRHKRLDLPELISELLTSGMRVVAHRHAGYWLDIGRSDDYQQAQSDYDAIAADLLPGEASADKNVG